VEARRAPTWDPVATVGLLVIGLIDVTRTVALSRDLGPVLDGVFQQAGYGEYTSTGVATTVGLVVAAVNVLGLVLAIALAVPRLRAHRTAFWIPLVLGLSCAVLTLILVVVAAALDPAFAAHLRAG
jgi:hypothetical protein